MRATQVIFDPALPWPMLAGLAVLCLAVIGFAAWRGLAAWALRGVVLAGLLTVLAGPSLQREVRDPLSDILLVVVDESASQGLTVRPDQNAAALAALRAQVAGRDGLEMVLVRLADGADDRGTLMAGAVAEALADLPRDRVAGVVMISDGQVHDADLLPDLPAPAHLLLTGQAGDWDRRLVVENAPAFAILNEEQEIFLRIEDQGAAPSATRTVLDIQVDRGDPIRHEVPVGETLRLPITLTHGGQNVIRFSVPEEPGELTARNNAAVVQISGVRDRLRVLLVSGQPHPGTRTWRNLLKSDASVDLVHFTILRPPNKQDGVPVSELSLIAFPTRELFMEKIDEFDLIIFDRYQLRGILPGQYLSAVRDYVEGGGAVLVAAGPEFATAQSLARSSLGDILPAVPSSRVIERAFRPEVTDLGARHPVTQGLDTATPGTDWGRWMRLVELEALANGQGQVVMEGLGRPLLALDRIGAGRVALLGSDHAWLWSRGFEGGGPQLELLRRLAHWMMKEPDLEEEALSAQAEGLRLTITRRSLGEGPREAQVTAPDGSVLSVPLVEQTPGLFQGQYLAPEMGLYHLAEGDLTAVAALGPAAPREFQQTVASGELLTPILADTGGGVARIEDRIPTLRPVRAGQRAFGGSWIGYTPREAYVTRDLIVTPLAPTWLVLVLLVGFATAAWLWEGRRRGW